VEPRSRGTLGRNENRCSFCPDAEWGDRSFALLRAERDATGNGRVYRLGFSATDGRNGQLPGNSGRVCASRRGSRRRRRPAALLLRRLSVPRAPGAAAAKFASTLNGSSVGPPRLGVSWADALRRAAGAAAGNKDRRFR